MNKNLLYHIITVFVEINIEIDEEDCYSLYNSIIADNDENISMECDNNRLKIDIKNAKIISIYNLIDDILRDYETFKKIKEL